MSSSAMNIVSIYRSLGMFTAIFV